MCSFSILEEENDNLESMDGVRLPIVMPFAAGVKWLTTYVVYPKLPKQTKEPETLNDATFALGNSEAPDLALLIENCSTMPPRRSYKKSTNGCKTCKRRRVKANNGNAVSASLHNHGIRHIVSCSCDLYLFTTEIQDKQLRQIWAVEVPSMAFQTASPNHITDLLLAVSALHLQYQIPADHAVRMTSCYYFSSGLRKFNRELSAPLKENSPLVFITRPILLRDESSWENWPIIWNGVFMGLLDGCKDENTDPQCMSININAIGYLDWAYTLCLAQEDKAAARRAVLRFPTLVPASYTSLPESQDPRALVITAHFFGLISMLDGVWWLEGVAEREILGILKLVPETWLWAMQWPLEQIHRREVSHIHELRPGDREAAHQKVDIREQIT
ncbi:hypothetical protein BX600DRAFT_498292 [Xylariales sp. PMI_506]|nr:hypothetical protein BX600DRAFT_498292 [Xylariales sp. PMI_506]